METLKILGQRLRELRKERKLFRRDLAELLEITLPHYQRIGRGIVTLADYYGVTTDYLLGRSEERGTLP